MSRLYCTSMNVFLSVWEKLVEFFLTITVIAVVTGFSLNVTAYAYYHDLCFKQAGELYNLNPLILKAIASVESDMQPYSLNVGGKTYRFDNLQKAYFFLKKHLSENPDIGLMQINYIWFKKLHIPVRYGLDPCYSIMLGAYILRRKINRYGSGWYGIAAYHSATPEKNLKYAWKIYGSLKEFLP